MHRFYKEPDQNVFFDLLPEDWRCEIAPLWDQYSENASIYLLEAEGHIVAGGIVFEVCPPDMLYNKPEADKWLEKGYLYIGFVWVVEAKRNKKYGSEWLKWLVAEDPAQKYWLTIEEEGLSSFYSKNGFHFVKALKNGDETEWLMSYEG